LSQKPPQTMSQQRIRRRGNHPTGTRPSRTSIGPRLALLALFVIAIMAFFYVDADRHLTFEALKNNRDRLLAYTQEHYVFSVLTFIGLYILQSTLSLPGSIIFTLAGGLLFGVVLGTLYDVTACTIGATLGFLSSRYVFRDWLLRRFGERLRGFQEGFKKDGFTYLLSLRLTPILPYFLINLLSGLTTIRVRSFVLATLLGSIPITFIYANAGQQIGSVNELGDIATPGVVGSLSLIGMLAVASGLYRFKKSRATAGHGAHSSAPATTDRRSA
jgi:uncharacterized membrane protein YdjX (TVP38/TMEM64 family)